MIGDKQWWIDRFLSRLNGAFRHLIQYFDVSERSHGGRPAIDLAGARHISGDNIGKFEIATYQKDMTAIELEINRGIEFR